MMSFFKRILKKQDKRFLFVLLFVFLIFLIPFLLSGGKLSFSPAIDLLFLMIVWRLLITLFSENSWLSVVTNSIFFISVFLTLQYYFSNENFLKTWDPLMYLGAYVLVQILFVKYISAKPT